jgi:hypothetical protein
MIETEVLMTAREELHRLVDYIPENDVSTTRKLLRALVDPVGLANLSADDDEPESAAERDAVEAALADPAPDVPFERLRRFRQ